jgi:hypothetical protein
VLAANRRNLFLTVTGLAADVSALTAGDLQMSFDGQTWYPVDDYTAPTARVLVGPGTTPGTPPLGSVDVYLRISAAPELIELVQRGALYMEAG